jgi:pimeloyl-ACP methyl ester carboxylesterase
MKPFAIGCALLLTSIAFADLAEPKDDYFTTSDGVKIHYLTQGDEGSWVVLIHGYTDTAQRMWFSTGIAPLLAENHRVVALDNRNHGQSDKPQPRGPGKAEDVVELMDHLGIEKAHIHGYSMGGGITGQLMTMIPGRFITAGFGGSGIYESDEKLRAQAAALDPQMPEPTGAAAAAYRRLRESIAARAAEDGETAEDSSRRFRRALDIDLHEIDFPVIAINGEFDRPYSKTQRMWRELNEFTNVVLPGLNHMTAIAVGVPMSQEYVDAIVRFINAYDESN